MVAHTMVQSTGVEVAPRGRHFIRRPRLTRLLDESGARLILLIAPAGYGKTTLAREWLRDGGRRAAWYQGSTASSDVAALAVGLAKATSAIVPGAGDRMRERLSVTDQPEVEAALLAELLAEDLIAWPSDAWLVIDDYHFAMETKAAEAFVEVLVAATTMRVLVASRRKPPWVSARRTLYGEALELQHSTLAMDDAEATAVLSPLGRDDLDLLLARAAGWPAVIGLASLTDALMRPDAELPESLHAYFADELFQAADPSVQQGLCRLAVAPALSEPLTTFLLDPPVKARVLSEGVRLGFLTPSEAVDTYDLHPLLRAFLIRKSRESDLDLDSLAVELGDHLIEERRWDDVFALIERYKTSDLLRRLVDAALSEMLSDGRLATITKWIDFGKDHSISVASLRLAEAELALREGHYARAEALALFATAHPNFHDSHQSRAYRLAGTAAHLDSRDVVGLLYHRKAQDGAAGHDDIIDALWGQFTCASELETEETSTILQDLQQRSRADSDDVIRLALAAMTLSHRQGQIAGIDRALAVLPLLDHVSDPMKRSSFLQVLGYSLTLVGRYAESIAVAEKALHDAERCRLHFAHTSACLVQAAARLGLGELEEAARFLDISERAAGATGDLHDSLNARLIRGRVLLQTGAFSEAELLFEPEESYVPPTPLAGERFAHYALALACSGSSTAARRFADIARRTTSAVEARSFSFLAQAVAAIVDCRLDASEEAQRAFLVVTMTGHYDAFVTAYRSFPALLSHVGRNPQHRSALRNILRLSGDSLHLAGSSSIELTAAQERSVLTPREHDVFLYLAQGLTNREIGQALYITVGTVKVHVRHILRKLGLRSRVEAALQAARSH